MAPLVLSHLVACAVAAALGAVVATRSRTALRRRDALRWAYEAARAEVAEAQGHVATARAELEAALQREVAARDEAEDAKALAATLEAEVVAVRWELDERERRGGAPAAPVAPAAPIAPIAPGDDRAREALKELEEKSQGVAVLHAALVDAVRQASVWEERAREAHRAGGAPARLVRIDDASASAPWLEPRRRAS